MIRKSFTLRPCQPPMIGHALNTPRCAVWAGTGFGKTTAMLSTLNILELTEPGPTLVIAPPRVARSTWLDASEEWDEFENFKVSCCVGTPDQRSSALKQKANAYTVSTENLPWLVDRLKNDWPFRKVIWDESAKLRGLRCSEQVSKTGKKFIRVGGSQRLRGIARFAHTRIDRFIELTATPSPSGLKNLWGQLWMLDAGKRLGRTHDSFIQRWFKTGYDGYTVEPLPGAEKEIMSKVGDLCISLTPEDWFDVKKPNIISIYVDLPPKARALYKAMEKKLYMEIKGQGIEAFNAGARTIKCRQLASGAAYHDLEGDAKVKKWSVVHDEKIAAIANILEENTDTPVIIVYDFKSDLARLKKAFPDGRHLDTKKDEDDFKAGKIEKLFMHFKSAAHGIDGFQYATNIMIIMSPDWNLEDFDQGVGRIGPVRQMQAGFDRSVFVYPIVARNTEDENVLKRWETRRSVQDLLLESSKAKGYA